MDKYLGRILASLLCLVVLVATVTGVIARPGPEITLPLLIIGGVLVLLLTLGLMSVLFETRGLSNRDHALALPEGSVRAVIALTLILLFGIVAIFLYGSMSRSGMIEERQLSAEERVGFLAKVSPSQILVDRLSSPAIPAVAAIDGKAEVPEIPAKYNILYRVPLNPASEDLAKQLVVLLGTLVTAVASFYFGANSVASATNAVGRGERSNSTSLDDIDQRILRPGPQPQTLTVFGSNLERIKTLKVMQGSTILPISDLKLGRSELSFKVLISEGRSGKWDLVANDGRVELRFLQAIEILSPETGPVPLAKLLRADKVRLKQGTTEQLKISGEHLDQIKKLELRANQDSIEVKVTGKTPAELGCTVDITADQVVGPWKLVGIDAQNRLAELPTLIEIGA